MSAPGADATTAVAASAAPAPAPAFRPTFLNMLGATILDENIRLLSDFLFQHAQMADVEIEGKLGLVFNKKKETRVYIDGVKSLVYVATDELDASFAAEIDANMFRHLNEDLIQRRYLEDQAKARAAGVTRPHWRYTHLHTTDKFHTVGNDRVRVSYDQSGAVVECIVKDKLQHMDFWNGKAKAIDFRISANRERKGQRRGRGSSGANDGSVRCAPSSLRVCRLCAAVGQLICLARSVIRSVARIACRIASTCGRSS